MIPRVIPVLTVENRKLVKTVRFRAAKYIGDPRNTVKLFNEKEVDELVLLDISKNRRQNGPDIGFITEIVSEAFMPVGYGGGVSDLSQIEQLIYCGVEKVIISSALSDLVFVTEAVKEFGSSTIVACVDYRLDLRQQNVPSINSNKIILKFTLMQYIMKVLELGVGEVIIQSIERDGTRSGYDLETLRLVSSISTVPIVALGGVDKIEDFRLAADAGASALAAGSFFIFYGRHQAVLVTYPNRSQLEKIFTR